MPPSLDSPHPVPPLREVVWADAIPWMRNRQPRPGDSVVTSLPDVSEVGLSLEAWRLWFEQAVRLVVRMTPDDGVALFFQSDIKRDGVWIDKGMLVSRSAEDAGARILFHKIVCRCPPGTRTHGRPGFTHLIAVSRVLRCPDILPIPDVIADPGPQTWVRAMGVKAAAHAVRFARDVGQARCIVDPFCGVGTVLAVANALGVAAVGVEKARKRAEQARTLTLRTEELG
jgi:hypothetical protein